MVKKDFCVSDYVRGMLRDLPKEVKEADFTICSDDGKHVQTRGFNTVRFSVKRK